MAPRLDRSKWVPKTQALTLYCLTEKQLDGLDHEERTNPRVRSGPPMKLFSKEQLERAALARWGSLAALEAERQRRQERREQRSIASYFRQVAQQGSPGAAAGAAEGPGQRADGQPAEQQASQPASPGSPEQLGQQQASGASPAAAQPGSAAPSPAAARQLPWLASLPPLIAERVCPVPREVLGPQPPAQVQAGQQQQQQQGGGEEEGGQYVLYWMKTAVRGHENPALDAAAAAARHLGLPLLAASFLLASHPYASVRRYKFVLEGLRDAQRELQQQGVPLLIYLEGHSEELSPAEKEQQEEWGWAAAARDPFQPGFGGFHPPAGYQQSAGWQALVRLASSAALVVTEDMPVPPDADALQALAAALPPGVQVVAVDAACLLPMRLVRKCYEKAYAFRSATEGQRKQRISRTYVPPAAQQQPAAAAAVVGPAAVAPAELRGLLPLPPQLAQPGWLGWQPLDLVTVPTPQLQQHLVGLLESCPGLDRSVPAVAHLIGGSGAGYARWERFRRQGLSLYAARRNNAMQRDGVSRLSAYHHWGMVSPFKVAREAALDRGAGAAKFLDEFLTWREIGFNLCLHRHHDLHSLAALPRWARDTLEQHAGDPRPAQMRYAQLDRGASGDAFWDAAQRQLVAAGELHNNVRMTWGKAFLGWSPSPQAALSAALHCNHRWALDGCDPASYAGVLWCFGMYDGPKAAAGTPISGSLAQRSTASHARRLSPAAYSQLPC